MARISKRDLLKNLSAARKRRHAEFSEDLNEFRAEMKPAKLADRMERSTRKHAALAGDKIADTARSHPAAALAIGSTLLAAILFRPAKSLLARLGDDSDAEADYDEI